jgi:hypothetical protein
MFQIFIFIQNSKKNYPNKIINKYWKPNINLKLGISKIFNSYAKKNDYY